MTVKPTHIDDASDDDLIALAVLYPGINLGKHNERAYTHHDMRPHLTHGPNQRARSRASQEPVGPYKPTVMDHVYAGFCLMATFGFLAAIFS